MSKSSRSPRTPSHIALTLAGILAASVAGMTAANAAPRNDQHNADRQQTHTAAQHRGNNAGQTYKADQQRKAVQNHKSGPQRNAAPAQIRVSKAPPTRHYRETRPRRPNARAVWIDGYWGWTGRKFAWVNGHWDAHPKGRWAAASWQKQSGGWVFIQGRWR